ncbi:unnamed protein product, partial [marine sediment metagenome]
MFRINSTTFYIPPYRGLGITNPTMVAPGSSTAPDTTIAVIAALAKAYPRCFSSKTILPAVQRSLDFAGTISTQGLSRFGGAASPASVQKEIDVDIGNLKYWKDRLATEPVTIYCDKTKQLAAIPGQAQPPAVSSDDYTLIENTIIGPYKTLYGID